MQQKITSKDKFDLDGFTKTLLDFLAGKVSADVHPSYTIMRVGVPGSVPEFGPEEGRSNFSLELEVGHLLSFPFSSSNVVGASPVGRRSKPPS